LFVVETCITHELSVTVYYGLCDNTLYKLTFDIYWHQVCGINITSPHVPQPTHWSFPEQGSLYIEKH